MNIKFGTDNFYVRYLKRFLNNELKQNTSILGEFNKTDLEALLKYLKLPNVENMFKVNMELKKEFTGLDTMFNDSLKDDEITYTSKSVETSEYLESNLEKIQDFCYNMGWEVIDVDEWVDLSKDIDGNNIVDNREINIVNNIVYDNQTYSSDIESKADLNYDGQVTIEDLDIITNYVKEHRLKLVLKKSNRKNYFPNKDMLIFINQFDGNFLNNFAIRDGVGIDDLPHKNNTGLLKVAIFKCEPGQRLTIAHNNTKTTRLVIGSSPAYLKQDIPSFILQNVQDIELKPRRRISIYLF